MEGKLDIGEEEYGISSQCCYWIIKGTAKKMATGKIAGLIRKVPLFKDVWLDFYATLESDVELAKVSKKVPYEPGWETEK